MYRVVDLRGLFEALGAVDFGGRSCKLKMALRDSFFGRNDGDLTVHFDDGHPVVRGDDGHDVAIQLDVAEFSSLIMGVVSFNKLYKYGLAQISDISYVNTIDRLFLTEEPPACMTWF
jgi:hypothetical protein